MVDFVMEEAQQSAEAESGARKLAIYGLVLSMVPFVASYRVSSGSSSTTTHNGQVISSTGTSSTFDYIAVPLGGLALVLGLIALVGVLRTTAASQKWKVNSGLLAAMAFVIGAYQVARGVGLT